MLHPQKGLTRSNHVKLMLRTAVIVSLIPMSLISFSGCEKKSGEAIVLAKDHIDAALPNTQTPNPQSGPSPNVEIREMADDEIEIDGYDETRDARHKS